MCYQKIGMQEATRAVTNEADEIGPELLADYLKRQKLEKSINSSQRLPSLLTSKDDLEANGKCLIVDCRSFIDYNNCHVRSAINAFYSKIMRRRLLDNKTCSDFILNHLSHGLGDSVESDNVDLILYAGDDTSRLTNHRNNSFSGVNENGNGRCMCAKNHNTKENCISDKETKPHLQNSLPTKIIDSQNHQSNEANNIQKSTENGFSNSTCSCRLSLTSSSSENFIRFLFEKLKDSTKLKFRRIMLLKGGFFTFQKQYPELCESSTQVRKSGALGTGDHPQSALTALPPSTCRPQTASLRLNSASATFTSNGFMNSNQQSSAEDSPLMRRQFALAEGPRTPQIENEQLLRSAQPQESPKVNFRMPHCPGTAPPALKIPCSWSQPCLRGLTRALQQCDELQACTSTKTSERMTQILDFMFLGSQNDALNPSLLQSYGITKVINLSETCPRPEGLPDDASHFLRIPIKDSYCAKLLPHFDDAFKFIENARRSGEKVLLHCLAGISRSATLAIAYIMRSQRLGSEEAYKFVKTRRQSISPNFNFMGQLMEYEKQLREQHILPPAPNCRPHSYTPGTSTTPNQDEPENNETNNLSNKPPSRPTSFACAPTNSVPSPMCRLSKSASSDFVHSMRDSFVNENGKRTFPLAGFPERPRQLMKKADRRSTLDPNGSSQTLKSVQEEVPSPSTEFSKLDISIANPCFGLNTNNTALSSENTQTSCEPETPAPAMCMENPFFLAPAAHRAGPPVPPRPEKKNSSSLEDCIPKSQSEDPKSAPAETHYKHTSSLLRCVFRKGRASAPPLKSHVKLPMIQSVATASTSVHHCHLPFKLKNCKGLRRFRKHLREHHTGIETSNAPSFDVLPTVPEPSESHKNSDSVEEDEEQYFSVDEDENSQSEANIGSPTNSEHQTSIHKRRSLSNQILFFKNSSRRDGYSSQSSSTHDDSPESGFVDDYYEHRSQSGGSLAGSSSCPQALSQHSLDTTSGSIGENEPTCALTDPERASLSSTSSLEIAVQ